MDISFYTAAVGAEQQQLRLNVHGNNIANVNTYGYQARRPSFSALMTGRVPGIEENLPRGVGSRLEAAEPHFRSNGMVETGRALDYAIQGDGFFALLNPTTGEFSYTRDGSFVMAEFQRQEQAEEAEGEEVPLAPPNQGEEAETVWYLSDGMGRFVVGRDGRPVEVTETGEVFPVGYELPIGIFDFVNYNGIQDLSDNRSLPVDKNGQIMLGSGTAMQGYLELSNTDLAYELGKVIESQRAFAYMLRMVQTSDEITTTVNNLR